MTEKYSVCVYCTQGNKNYRYTSTVNFKDKNSISLYLNAVTKKLIDDGYGIVSVECKKM